MASIGSVVTLSGFLAFFAISNTFARPTRSSKPHLKFPDFDDDEFPMFPEHNHKDTLLDKVIIHALKEKRLEPRGEGHALDKDFVRRRLEETLIHVRDLIYRANDTYNLLCHQKHMLLPHNDRRLSTCRGFTEASLEMRKTLNVPDHAVYPFGINADPEELLKIVYHKSWEITLEYEFVVSNMTTLEEDYLCNGHSCEIKCASRTRSSDPHSFLCQLRTLESRINSFSKILERSMNMLHLTPTTDKQFVITERPKVSEHTRLMYNFAASYQLYRQAEQIEYALQFAKNIVLSN